MIPISNAIVERVFSAMNMIKTRRRNRMKTFVLNMLLRINLLAPKLKYIGKKRPTFTELDYEAFDFERAYTIWKDKCNRNGFVNMLMKLVDDDDE